MKILFSSHSFYPNIGGLETVSALLAQEFVCLGHEVKLITRTLSSEKSDFPFEIFRRPTPVQFLKLVGWCEVFFHNNISLLAGWPLLLVRRPWIVAHHIWLPEGSRKAVLKRFMLRFATGISVSHALAEHFSTPSTVINNPYDDRLFYERPEIARDRDLVFVGRLLFDKGVHLLLEALVKLRAQDHYPNLTIIGNGPEEANLRRMVTELGLQSQVTFAGVKRGEELALLLNRHRVLVVPSLWQEPAGVVALEGMACGCVVVGSAGGGLKEMIGPAGLTFPNGDSTQLAAQLVELCARPAKLQELRASAPAHLAQHTRRAVALAYLQVFEKVE
jgi:glycosyltransferase involved in cell wall biosynthesis